MGNGLAAYAIADTLQFDLKDVKGALAEYRKLVTPMPPKAPPGMDFPTLRRDTWAQRWLRAQIAYLESGKTFQGALIAEDLSIGEMVFDGNATAGDLFALAPVMRKVFQGDPRMANIDRKEVDRALRGLPPSALALAQSASLMSLLPDAPAILAHLARQDPAGYASACYFALVGATERNGSGMALVFIAPGVLSNPAPLREARTRFLREHRIDTKAIDDAGRTAAGR
jgi:hypothetical protein